MKFSQGGIRPLPGVLKSFSTILLAMALLVITAQVKACDPVPSGIIGWWPGQQNAHDIISTNNGILDNGVTFSNGIVDKAFHFNGSNQDVQIPYTTALEPSNVTVECWVKLDALASQVAAYPGLQYIVFKQNSRGGNFEAYELEKNRVNGQDVFRFQVTSADGEQVPAASVTVPQPGVWYHLAGTYDGTTVKIYVNGVLEGSATAGFPIDYGTEPLYFATTGQSYDGRFEGTLDEISIYGRALGSNEIAAIYNVGSEGKCPPSQSSCTPAPSGVVAWWPGESNTVDIINGNNGTAVGNLSYASGEVGQAFVLDGSTSYITVPPSSSLDVGNNGTGLTIEGWVNPSTANGAGDGAPIMEWDSSSTDGAQFWADGDGSLFTDIKDTSNTGHTLVTAAGIIPSNTWTHVALTYDKSSGNVLIFANGTVVASGNFGSITPQTSYPLNIGRRTGQPIGNGDTFAGSIDELSLYNRALGTNEIAAIYNAGTNGKCPPAPSSCYPVPANIAAWWPAESNTDDIINGNNGTAIGNLTYASGEVGEAFVLDGSTSYITVPPSSSLNVGTNGTGLTIECWINPSARNTMGDGAPIMEWDSSSTDGAQFWADGDGSLFTDIKDTTGTGHTLSTAAGIVPTNTWTHVALTYDKSSGAVLIYANGNVVGSANFGTITPQTSYPLNIGRRTGQPIGNGDTFAGSIDELSLYNRALGSNEIAGIYHAGSEGKCPSQTGISPFIITQPANQTVTVGDIARFSVVAGGSTPLSYLWITTGTNNMIVGTNATLIFTNVQQSQTGGYQVSVSNPYGTTNSIVATLNVLPPTGLPPHISIPPHSETVTVGGTALFRVIAGGTQPLSYQWTFQGSNIVGATSAILTLNNMQTNQAGTYLVHISNPYGTTNSAPVTLTVNPPIPSCYPVPTNIVAWWPAESNTDDIINGNNGTTIGNLGYASGEVGQAFVLDGSTSYITVPPSPSLDVGNNGTGLTIECWVNPSAQNTMGDGAPIMEWDSSSTDGAQFWVDGDGSLFTDIKDTNGIGHTLVTAPGVVPTNTWTHIALTYDKNGGPVLIYTNGQIAASGDFGVITPQTSYPLNIGRRTGQPIGNGDTFAGMIDELSLYNRALGTNEIAAIYNAGSEGKCPPSPVAPYFLTQPTNQTVTLGSTASFSIVAGGTAPLSYVWMFFGTNSMIVGTNATLTLNNVQTNQAGGYQIFVSNSYGTTNSIVVTLTVNPQTGTPPFITRQPTNETVTAGSSAIFSVSAGGTAPLSYIWMTIGTNDMMVGTNATLTLNNVQTNQAGHYQVTVSNAYGTTNSVVVTLTVHPQTGIPPFINNQPTNQTVNAGGTARFTVGAGGTGPLTYTWKLTGTNSLVVGTGTTLFLTNVQPSQAGGYQVTVTNLYGTTNSVVATLTVLVPPAIQHMTVRANGLLTLDLASDSSMPYILYCTTNLTPPIVWVPIYTNSSGKAWQFTDTNNCGVNFAKYYRVAPTSQ